MRKSLIALSLMGAFAVSTNVLADEADEMHSHPEEKGTAPGTAPAAEPASPHTFTYNIGLYSQYIFRGLTQTDRRPALQGGVDYSHSSGIYVGTWGSNISWLEDGGNYHRSSLEWDIYGGFRNTFGDTGIGYDVGLLNYVYPGDKTQAAQGTNFDDPYTLEAYAALSWKWLQLKYSYAITDAFGVKDSDGTYYAEANANIPVGESGFTVNLHLGRQEFDGKTNTAVSGPIDNDNFYSYTDWKVGLTKSWANGVNIGGYYTDTNAKDKGYTISNRNIGDSTFTAFIQKTF
ncbi:MAG TPA: TorF family putative porin [Methylophilaceae bacterium]|nr:TorF family putative porin [Methylophilaceae bacterium]